MGTMHNVKAAYTATEWAARESYYVDAANKIDIPSDPMPRDVKHIISQLDTLISEALLDYSYVRRAFSKAENVMKLATTETFSIVKANNSASNKLTADDVKSLVVSYLRKNPLPGYKICIYDLVANYEDRQIFMQEMVRMLQGKKEALITDTAMIKIESNLTP